MKRTGILMLAMALTFAAACDDDKTTPAGPSNTGPIIFSAQLSAANEVPPITGTEANARGSVTATFNVPRDSASGAITGGGTVTFAMQASSFPAGTPIVAAHIHPGAAGVNGNVVVSTGLSAAAPLLLGDGSGNLTVQNITITQDLATQIAANPAGYYFNMHTPTNPGGAIRGQLTRQ